MWNMLTRASVNKVRLILLAAFGLIVVCVGSCGTHGGTSSGGLSCRVSVPQRITLGTLPLTLILKNAGSQPLRICTDCGARRTHKWNPKTGEYEFGVWLIPGIWEGDMASVKGLKQSIVTLPPGGEVGLPVNMWPETRPIRLTGHYAVPPYVVGSSVTDDPEFKKLDIWRGTIAAPPVTLRVSK